MKRLQIETKRIPATFSLFVIMNRIGQTHVVGM